MSTLLRRIEKSAINQTDIEAFRHRVDRAQRLARSSWLIAAFEGAFAAELGEQQCHHHRHFERGNPRIEKLYIFGNKARDGRVSGLAAQFGAIWRRSAHRESQTWPEKALRIVDRD